ncbi:MAG: sodium-dependent transporter, partial [Lachnospiraceae bacterium]
MEKPKSLGRDSFKSSFGFIIACIGSAVGMGNIWLFPRRVSEFGAPFLIAYLVCVVVIGFTGVIGEMAFGRASKAGPMG